MNVKYWLNIEVSWTNADGSVRTRGPHGYPVEATEEELLAVRVRLLGRRAGNSTISAVTWEPASLWTIARVVAEYEHFR